MEPQLASGTKTKIEFLAIATLKFRARDSGSEGRGVGIAIGRGQKTRGGTPNVQRGTWIPARRVTHPKHINTPYQQAYIIHVF